MPDQNPINLPKIPINTFEWQGWEPANYGWNAAHLRYEYVYRNVPGGPMEFTIVVGHQAQLDAAEQKFIQERALLPEKVKTDLLNIASDKRGSLLNQIQQRISAYKNALSSTSTEISKQSQLANLFYGSDPLTKTRSHAISAIKRKGGRDVPKLRDEKKISIEAAYKTKLLSETANLITDEINALTAIHDDFERGIREGRPGSKIRNGSLAYEELKREGKLDFTQLVRTQTRSEAIAIAKALILERENQWEVEELARNQAELETQNRLEAELRMEADLAAGRQEAERVRQAGLRLANTFNAVGEVRTRPFFIAGGLGTIASAENPSFTLGDSIRAAAAELARLAAIRAGQWVGTFATLALYSSPLGNGERQSPADLSALAMTAPLASLTTYDEHALAQLAQAKGSIAIPLRVDQRSVNGLEKYFLVPTATVAGASEVRIREAIFDAVSGSYRFTTEGNPGRTIIWTPASAPGSENGSSTSSPIIDPDHGIYTGAVATPVPPLIEPHPDLDGYEPDDYIFVAPGIEPLYVVFQSPRDMSGIVSGTGEPFTEGTWLGELASTTGVAIPETIANDLRGQEFITFGKFREAVWKAVSFHSELNSQFTRSNQDILSKGKPPFPRLSEQVGGRAKYELHHVIPIARGGAVYDIDNIRILTPKAHINIHKLDKP